MTYTYDSPGDSRKDAMRFLTGDTDSSQPLLQDEEIEYLITAWYQIENDYMLASYCAEAIAGKFAREITLTSDSQTLQASELQEKYLSLALRLRAIANSAHPGSVYAGGMEAGVGWDPTTAPLSFGTQMHDDPAAGQQDFGDGPRGWFNELTGSWQP